MKINITKFETETIKEMNILKAALEKVDFTITGSKSGGKSTAYCPCKASFDGQMTVIEPIEGYTISEVTAGTLFNVYAKINWESQEAILADSAGEVKYLIKRNSARK